MHYHFPLEAASIPVDKVLKMATLGIFEAPPTPEIDDDGLVTDDV